MEFSINRDVLLKSLSHANGIIEKKTTLPILSNILIEAKGSKISRAAIAKMIELVGEDLRSMENELEKLSIYKHDQTIEIQDIEQMTSGSRDTNIFELVDRVIEGKTEQSIKLMDEMTAGESASTYSPTYLIAMIARQVRLIA